jgi:hypothetical protein
MSPAEILAEAAQSGLRIQLRGENLIVAGLEAKPAQLLEAIRSHKAEIIGVLQGPKVCCSEGSERSEESQNQARAFPPIDLPLPGFMPVLAPKERTRVIDLVMRQGKPAIGWCLQRSNAYYEKFPSSGFEDQDAASALDLLNWQGE